MSEEEFRDEFLRVDHCVVRLANGSVYFLEADEYEDVRRQAKMGHGEYETVNIFGGPVFFRCEAIADVSRHTNETMERRRAFQDRLQEILGGDENVYGEPF